MSTRQPPLLEIAQPIHAKMFSTTVTPGLRASYPQPLRAAPRPESRQTPRRNRPQPPNLENEDDMPRKLLPLYWLYFRTVTRVSFLMLMSIIRPIIYAPIRLFSPNFRRPPPLSPAMQEELTKQKAAFWANAGRRIAILVVLQIIIMLAGIYLVVSTVYAMVKPHRVGIDDGDAYREIRQRWKRAKKLGATHKRDFLRMVGVKMDQQTGRVIEIQTDDGAWHDVGLVFEMDGTYWLRTGDAEGKLIRLEDYNEAPNT